ncbi:heterokaryon incompatibility protein-domain-containing protein [Plectosphaerella cucumerina]|uniref:Heterokaryon incompatibility protein-domain-containing protein n=1 Tax=Plectosphaerella cucumerina TaxID=40658 RepID=A0A8K0X2J8_9PEZI|nr:heterokaryon incompatibility protein-domain-containing protein [Plectosphaerella cucumerina]
MTLLTTIDNSSGAVPNTGNKHPSNTLYHYQGLSGPSCIRVVEAALGDEDGEISCQLREIDIDPSPDLPVPYHCLSYTWGGPFKDPSEPNIWTETFRIHVSGPGDASGHLFVTKNLHDFLQELARRNPSDVHLVWIDAICINQEDMAERAAQVSIMRDVYLNCEAVIVWFGVEDPDATAAFSVMARIELGLDEYMARIKGPRLTRSDWYSLYAILGTASLPPDVFISCGRFLRRSWLYRIWTLQESILPRAGSVWCGSLQTPLQCLGRLIDAMSHNLRLQYHPVLGNVHGRGVASEFTVVLAATLEHLLHNRDRVLRGQPLGYIETHRGADCSDPRDKVYGLLGLLKDTRGTVVDYSKSVVDVYRDFASSLGPLACIAALGDPSFRVTKGLPSWVPEYHADLMPRSWRNRGGGGLGAGYCAGDAGGRKVEKLNTDSPLLLALSGFEEDVVEAVGASYDETVYGGGILRSLELLLERLVPGSGEDHIEVFWRVLIANLPGNSNRPPRSDKFGPSFRALACFLIASHISKDECRTEPTEALMEKLKQATNSPYLPDWADIQQLAAVLGPDKGDPAVKAVFKDMQRYLESLTWMSLLRRFFVTRKNRLCLGSHTVREGDRVFILSGFNYPVLLRPASDGRFTVIGDIYVRGIMFGEALEGRDFHRVEIE